MNYKIILAVCFWLGLLAVSCNRDDMSFDAPSAELRFSKDTVFCDTVYHQVRSETYAVKVYNDEDKDIMIPSIRLGRGAASLYKINVDGKSGFQFNNVPLRKKDSLYIFVEIAPEASGPQAIAEDNIYFESPVATQKVTLFSVVQDAEFFVQTSAPNSNTLSGTVNWTNNKAKIIYGDLTLSPGTTLNIAQDTKVYFFKNSGMKVQNGATMNVNGDLGHEVSFRGDRNDSYYDTIPKNWNSMRFETGAMLNMNYARVFGGIRGLDMRQSTATIKNSIIHTFDEYGIYAVNSTITAENLVLNNCQFADFGIYKGGTYNLTHCTLANFWKPNPSNALYATNEWTNDGGNLEFGALSLNIKNSIIHSQAPNSIVFNPIAGQTFSYLIQNTMLNYSSGAGFNFDSNPSVVNSWQNLNPDFMNTSTTSLNLRVNSGSEAKSKGNAAVAATVPLDLVKISRTVSPTLGAYQ